MLSTRTLPGSTAPALLSTISSDRLETSAKLSHPRLSPDLYHHLCDKYLSRFHDLFTHVVNNPEAPGKTSYGDIDLLLCGPKTTELKECRTLETMAQILKRDTGARGCRFSNDILFLYFLFPEELLPRIEMLQTMHGRVLGLKACLENADSSENMSRTESAFTGGEGRGDSCIPPPTKTTGCHTSLDLVLTDNQFPTFGEEGQRLGGVFNSVNGNCTGIEHVYEFQIDMALCEYPSSIPWCTFLTAYGDLASILRAGHSPTGLTFRPSGLFVHIPEIYALGHPAAKEASLVFLTNDPIQMFHFLGMEPETYSSGFGSEQELFAWASSSEHFSTSEFWTGTSYIGPTNRKGPSAFDKRLTERHMYQRFIHNSLPQCQDLQKRRPDHYGLVEQAMLFFGAPFRHRYHATHHAFTISQQETRFWSTIHATLPTLTGEPAISKNRRNLIALALKRYTVFGSRVGHAPTPTLMLDLHQAQLDPDKFPTWTRWCDEGGCSEAELTDFIRRHWSKAFELDRARTRPARHEKRDAADARKIERRKSLGAKLIGKGLFSKVVGEVRGRLGAVTGIVENMVLSLVGMLFGQSWYSGR